MTLRVLHVISSLDPRAGGPPAAIRGLALAQNELDIDVHIVSTRLTDFDPSIETELLNNNIQVENVGPVRLPLGLHRDLRPTLAKAILRSDAVHIHGLWEDIQHKAATEANRQRKPYIIRPCGMLDPWSLNQSKYRKKIYMAWRLRSNLNKAKALHYTAAGERDLAEPLGLKPQAIVEPNGIDLSEFDPLPKPGRFRARFPEIGDRRIVLFLSRLHHKKGLDLLIPAFAQSVLRDTVLVLAGPCEKDYRRELNEKIRAANCKNSIIFAGMQRGQERVEAYVDAELFVLPSYQENFGIVVVESLAAGTPVIISDQVNIWPEIKAAGVGMVCQTDIGSVKNYLVKAMASSDQIASFDDCRRFVKERYDWRAIADRWAKHITAVI